MLVPRTVSTRDHCIWVAGQTRELLSLLWQALARKGLSSTKGRRGELQYL